MNHPTKSLFFFFLLKKASPTSAKRTNEAKHTKITKNSISLVSFLIIIAHLSPVYKQQRCYFTCRVAKMAMEWTGGVVVPKGQTDGAELCSFLFFFFFFFFLQGFRLLQARLVGREALLPTLMIVLVDSDSIPFLSRDGNKENLPR
jgi:hypothetical protein